MARKILVAAVALFTFAAAFALKESQRQDSAPGTGHSFAEGVKNLPRLVDLGSDQCVPCKQMAPILDALAEEYRGSLVVEIIDVRRNPDAGREWGIQIIPTQVFIDGSGRERFRHEGFISRESILAKWEELGVPLSPTQARMEQ